MPDRVTRFFMLVPGPWSSTAELLSSLSSAGVDVGQLSDAPPELGSVRAELVVNAAGFGVEMSWGRQGRLPAAVVDACAQVRHAALVEVALPLDQASGAAVAIGRALRSAGGIAVRMEGAGIASEWGPWFDKMQAGTPAALVAAAVLFVGGDEGWFFSCGMHQFDLPDVELESASAGAAVEWMQEFCAYSLAERPTFCTGHTFSPDPSTPGRKLERWPDRHHDPMDGRHNPYGHWRALSPGAPGLDWLNPEPVPVPALVAVLMMSERKAGRALSREEVERLAEETPSIAMEPEDARKLEVARGYADLEPRRAWAQWEVFRARRS